MKIGIDVREVIQEKAGKGYFTANLVLNILKLDKKNEYFLYTNQKLENFAEFANVSLKIISNKGLKWHKKVLKDAYKENLDVFFAPTSYVIPAKHNPKKIKVITVVHDLVALLFPAKHNKKAVWVEKFFIKRAIKKSALICAVSKNTKKDLIKKLKCDEKKIHIIHNAASGIYKQIPTMELSEILENNDFPEHFILSAGTLEPRKNITSLIKAFAQITEKFPKYKLLIVGKKGWYYDKIFKTVKTLALEEKVVFLGYVSDEDLVALYNLATIFVYPSLYEGFGIPPIEAMQCGCPVITSNTSSLPEVVSDAALQVEPNNIEKLAFEIESLLKDNKLRQKLIARGFKQAMKFSWEKSAKKALELFEKALQ
ncbi:glycosyltransferase family 4 protein [Patescibacteria group bacterium]|nr:glycosyltransferase family 4 protein [Patescibacteria group bacterium]